MRKIIQLLIMVLFLPAGPSHAAVNVEPADLGVILQKITARQAKAQAPGGVPAEITIKDGQIVFLQDAGKLVSTVTFSDTSPTIIKHVNLKDEAEHYAFNVILRHKEPDFNRVVKKMNGADALVFFNDTDVFVYTQTGNENGSVELEEWVYARKPNTAKGSQWTWVFKSDSWEWPMSMDIGEAGEAKLSRNVPIAGFPIVRKAKDNYLLQMMIKIKEGDQIKSYFPFKEEIGSLPPPVCLNKEGIKKHVNVGVSNTSVFNPDRPKPKHGLDFGKWDDYWQSLYTISIDADPSEYPLLISPK